MNEVKAMATYVYPAFFIPEGDLYSVVFPDIPGCYTCGDNLLDAIDMAKDVLALWLCALEDVNSPIPTPTAPSNITHQEKDIVIPISCDTIAYRHLTALTIEEGRQLAHDSTAKRYHTMDALRNALLKD